MRTAEPGTITSERPIHAAQLSDRGQGFSDGDGHADFESSVTASAVLTVTPGFLQPLTPENAALGANGHVTITGYLAEAGGHAGITYALSNTATRSSGGQGSLGATNCMRGSAGFTYCTVTYTAPATISATGGTWIVATVGSSASRTASEVLLNTAGVSSDPASHQAQADDAGVRWAAPAGTITTTTQRQPDCGLLRGDAGVTDSGQQSARQYLLSNNHVLARSDQAKLGET